MPKKTKKQIRKVSSVAAPAMSANGAASAFSPALAASRSGDADFKPDYSATIKDLKRIGFLAGSFFIVLVVLSIFLR